MQYERRQEMKQPKKLTRQLKEAVTAYGLNADNWMLLKGGDTYVTIIHTGGSLKVKYNHETREVEEIEE